MLQVNIRDLSYGPVATEGALEAGDPLFEGLDLPLDGPLAVDGTLQETQDGSYLWRGHFAATLTAECGRCLRDMVARVDQSVDVLFSADPELAEDPSVYPLEPRADTVDLRPAIREELVLSLPAFTLCQDDCKGLCANCGADLNAGPCGCTVSGMTN
jgi:uncharacterized protein